MIGFEGSFSVVVVAAVMKTKNQSQVSDYDHSKEIKGF